MTQPRPAQDRSSPSASRSSSPDEVDADAHDFAEFLAGQNPLDTEAADWQVRRQDGLTAEEEAEFQEWLTQDPSHQAAFDRLEGVWGRLDKLPSEGVAQLKAGLGARSEPAGVPGKPQAPSQPTRPASRPASPGRRTWMFDIGRFVPQIASAAIAFAVVGGGWFGWDYWQQQPIFTKTYATARGQQFDVRLPDGSALKLDTATRAEVTLYRQRREVRLPEGQAMFSVKADTSQPFDVLAGPLRITVVGTRFSVRNTLTGLSSDGVSVVVEEGRVRVAPAQAGAASRDGQLVGPASAVELTAGQAIQADATGRLGPVAAQSPDSAMLWREGRVNFERTPLTQALAEFERYGATRLVISDPAVGAMRVNGSFDLRQLGAFTKALPQVLPVRLLTRDGVTEVVAAD
jgi:transmembrane sensor